LERQADTHHGEDIVEAREDMLRYAWNLVFEAVLQVAQTFDLPRIVHLPMPDARRGEPCMTLGVEAISGMLRTLPPLMPIRPRMRPI